MDSEESVDIFQMLQTFLLLKKQNHLIYAWMQLKKNNKRQASITQSRSKSRLNNSFSNRQDLTPKTNLDRLKDTYGHRSQKLSTPKIYSSNQKIGFDHLPPNNQEEMYQTFNKQPQNPKYRLTEQPSQNYLNRSSAQGQVPIDLELQDSEQFEDIVLDRLSKLEQNINRMMRDKQKKQQQRGYVGTPINPHIHSRKVSHQMLPQMEQQCVDESNQIITIQERKKRFFEMIGNSSPSRGSQQCKQVQIQPHNIVYNIKYIPVGREEEPNVNIQKIRQMMQRQTHEEQNLIEDVEFFNGSNLVRVNREEKGNYRSQQNSKRNQLELDQPLLSPAENRESVTNSSTYKRYGVAKTSRHNQIHFVPRHIEMQTVIEPNKKKYFRHNPNPYLNSSLRQEQRVYQNSFDRPYFKAKDSKASNSSSNTSRVSYQTSKLNNLSSYY